MFGEEEPVKQEAPEEPDDSDAGLDDTGPFQYHRQSRGPSTQDYNIVYAAGPTKQVRPFLGLALGTSDRQCSFISPSQHAYAAQARTQHIDNLIAVLEESLLQGRYERVAGAASILVPLTVSTPLSFPTDNLSKAYDPICNAKA